MVENKKSDLVIYSQDVEKLNQNPEEKKSGLRTVELFFSFDIVNSSAYKNIDYYGWPVILTSLLRNLQDAITKEMPTAQLWRVLGDEIIFFVTIKETEEIYNCVDSIFSILCICYRELRDGVFFERQSNMSEQERSLIKDNNVISLQAAAWIAIVVDGIGPRTGKYDNVFEKYKLPGEEQQIYEFLGKDIDTGFRIKEEKQARRLTVSLELAYLLKKKEQYLENLHIITYKSLKGVWEENLYPVIWYHDKRIYEDVSFEDSFYYDEIIYSQLSEKYFENRKKKEYDLASYMYTDTQKALEKIVADRKLHDKIQEILTVIQETDKDVRAVESAFRGNLPEMHVAAVCCKVKERKILIVRRAKQRFLSGLWEFGCAKASIETDLNESIEREYRNDFGIEIQLVCDKDRLGNMPVPAALYQVDKAGKKQKGVIVVAKVEDDAEIGEEYLQKNGKHEEVRWIGEEETDDFQEEAVDNFKNTLKYVFRNWDRFFGEEE